VISVTTIHHPDLTNPQAPTLDQILLLARRGWRMFPCPRREKKPLIAAWPRLASFDPRVLRRWGEEHPNCNWGVACGVQSGVFILDVDGERGFASLVALEREHGPLPVTLTSITGRADGGEHRWFNYPLVEVRNSASKLGAGLDIRAEGGYAIIPPSTHQSGQVYRWIDDAVPVADAPGWLVELLSCNSANGRETPLERSIFAQRRAQRWTSTLCRLVAPQGR
jgi:hypothetical protein